MDIGSVIDNSFPRRRRRGCSRLRFQAIGLNVRFGYTGLLNFRPGGLRRGGRTASPSGQLLRLVAVGRYPPRPRGSRGPGPAGKFGLPTPAPGRTTAIVTIAAGRDHPTRRPVGDLQRPTPAARRPERLLPSPSTTSTPTAPGGSPWARYSSAATTCGWSPWAGRWCCSMTSWSGARCAAPGVVGAQGHPRGTGRHAQPGQERLLVQDAEPHPRRPARRGGRLRLRHRQDLGAAGQLLDRPTSPSSPTPPSSSAVPPPPGAR